MKKIVLYAVIIFQILIIISLIRGVTISRRSASRIQVMQETKAKLEEERDKLKKEQENVNSEFYLEKVAREELHLTKPGETVVIVPESVLVGTQAIDVREQELEVKPNWILWYRILSGQN
jgi:cell division protein FtsB